jgi:hypothetical protein
MERRWRRTSFKRLDGSTDIALDDWCLHDENDRVLARIYKMTGGPQSSRWFWAVQVGLDGEPRNGGTGYFATGKEARETCEALTKGIKAKAPSRSAIGSSPQ